MQYFFSGEQMFEKAVEDLTEVDTDVSSMLRFNGHAETVQKVLDVARRKRRMEFDFVIFGLETISS